MTGHSTQKSGHGTAEWAWDPPGLSGAVLSENSWWVAALRGHDGVLDFANRGDNRAAWHLEPDSESVKVARGLFRATACDWGMGHVVSDVELIVSELLTNALRHTPAPARGEAAAVQVVALHRGDEFVCAVRDHSDLLPSPREPDFMAETGRGLQLVACFSRQWGVTPVYPHGKFVWALLS
ncbi:ATP-binding protein [Spiractinospora alimapuensis]|uniref:ATP-binding protein n=1 Tax=Spiractinospora alimapuensis TaxID=2820884 RepID=UPI003744AEE7|nr:ATP-binding protein [Spiractinospora alimapuensis]